MNSYSRFNVYLISILVTFFCACANKVNKENSDKSGLDKPDLENYYKKLLADPATGIIPANIHAKELFYANGLPVYYGIKRGEDIWKSRGPNNQGGRTRGLAIDVKNSKHILAGSATGGIWESFDEGKSWKKSQCPANAITCIKQDTRPGKTDIWYAGTGELTGSSGSGGGAYYYGAGIMKSTDNGSSWTILPSTAGLSTTFFDSDFDGVWNIVIDVSNTSEDEVYAATYGGIYKSLDGGATWKKKRSGSLPNYSYYTDVAITKLGVVYATMSSESTHKGIWRSTDGETWISITPSGFPSVYGRMCIGIAESDQNQVYIAATGTTNAGFVSYNFLGVAEWNSLWKYDFVSGNGSGTGGRWINRSANLPDKGGDFGYYSTQGGYDLFIHVKPNDTNVVFIGATNLWRSTDAFRSNTKTDWIGGYAVNTSRPDFQLYAKHHPDNHLMLFYPGSNNKVFSAHDGGISFTEDVMANQVVWEDRSNNYITSQFYTVAIDQSLINDHRIIGGLQDNGTMFMNVYGMASWQMTYNGDGSYCTFKNGTNEVFASAQQGRMAHLEIDAIGRPVKYARIDPSSLSRSDYDFINPFAVDPNNQNTLYLPARKRLFRNLDINAKSLSSTFDSVRWNTPLWEELTNCVPITGNEFSAITVSKADSNTLYYATDRGRLYKIKNAHGGQPSPVEITGNNFSTGNISCIALDPLDSNRITVVFSNYGVISLLSSGDGGQNWVNISGNLEENSNGSGNGPSCRWAAVMTLSGGNKCWFIGTSVGLFATDTLNGLQTRWIRQSPNGIGNNIVTMITARQADYYLAVATHGNGVYSANIASPWQITSTPAVQAPGLQFRVFPNPVTSNTIQIILNEAYSPEMRFELRNYEGKLFSLGPVYDNGAGQISINLPSVSSGIYLLSIRHGNRKWLEKVFIQGL